MNCDFQFALSSVVCKPDKRPILDFGEDQMDIFLSEIGLIRGQATINFEICSTHLDRLAHLKKSRKKCVRCGVPGHLTSHLPGRPDPHGDRRVTSAMMLKIHCCTGAVLPIGTRMYFVKMEPDQLKLRQFVLVASGTFQEGTQNFAQ